MRIAFAVVLMLGSLVTSPTASAQTVNYLNPPGGLTIKELVIENNGWAFLTFAEPTPDLNVCQTFTRGGVTYTNVLWIDFSGTYDTASSAKLSYGTAAIALVAGKKIAGVEWRQISYWCDAFGLRLNP